MRRTHDVDMSSPIPRKGDDAVRMRLCSSERCQQTGEFIHLTPLDLPCRHLVAVMGPCIQSSLLMPGTHSLRQRYVPPRWQRRSAYRGVRHHLQKRRLIRIPGLEEFPVLPVVVTQRRPAERAILAVCRNNLVARMALLGLVFHVIPLRSGTL